MLVGPVTQAGLPPSSAVCKGRRREAGAPWLPSRSLGRRLLTRGNLQTQRREELCSEPQTQSVRTRDGLVQTSKPQPSPHLRVVRSEGSPVMKTKLLSCNDNGQSNSWKEPVAEEKGCFKLGVRQACGGSQEEFR